MADMIPSELSEEDFNLLLSLGIMPDKSKNLESQLAAAQALREDAMKGPEMRGNYRVQRAAHPLEFLAKGVQGYRAGKEIKDLQAQQDELLGQQNTARQKFAAALLRRGRTPPISDIGVDESLVPMPDVNY